MATLFPLTFLTVLLQQSILSVVHAEPRLSLSSTSQILPALSWPAALASSSSNNALVNKYALPPDHRSFNLFSPIISSAGFSSSRKGFSLGFLSVFHNTDATASPSHIFLAICLGSAQKDANGRSFAVPVWVANKDNPLIVPKQGRIGLYLNAQKELLLVDGDGKIAWAVRAAGLIVAMELRDDGNLEMYNAENESVWQSFDYPGDALVPGQALPLGKRIASSNDLFAGEMRAGGLFFYMQSSLSVPLAYFLFALNQTVNKYINDWLNQGSFQLSRNLPINLTAAMYANVSFTPPCRSDKHIPYAIFDGNNITLQYADTCPSGFNVPWLVPSYFQNHILGALYDSDLARLDPDGILRGYSYLNHDGEHFFSSDLVNYTLCLAPNTCGSYGLCSHYVVGQEHICKCPSADENPDLFDAFAPVDAQNPSLGCHRTIPLQCKEGLNQSLVRIQGATFLSFRAIFEATLMYNMVPLDACLRQCESNCSCVGVYYHRSSSFCLPFCDGSPLANVSLLRIDTEDYATYLKVQFSSEPGNVVPGEGKSAGRSSKKLAKSLPPALIVTGLLVVGCIVALFVAHKLKQRWSQRNFLIDEKDSGLELIMPMLPTRFSYKELCRATNGFSQIVGKGGFGSVFEGMLTDSRKVAVKRLETVSPQMKTFLTEVATIGSISHYNIVRLFGFCSERANRLLVYEYMENGSLDRWIFCKESKEGGDKDKFKATDTGPLESNVAADKGENDRKDKASCCCINSGASRETTTEAYDWGFNEKKAKSEYNSGEDKIYTVLSWETRYNVALGTARALAYLHEECRQSIIHFDIKPENILLDADFVPKVADFGLAKLVERGVSSVHTMVRGTAGYVAPEWFFHALASKKCDVYSYGMVLLELIGGRRNADAAYVSTDQWYLPKWAAICCREGNEGELVDKRLRGCYDAEQMKRLLQVAFLCIHREPGIRPSMSTVCKLLEESSKLRSGSCNGIANTVTSEGEELPLSKLFLETLSQYDNIEATSEIAFITSTPSLPYSSIEGR